MPVTGLLGRARLTLIAIIVFIALVAMLATARTTIAAPLEAHWSLYARADASSFVAGSSTATGGYEVVSFHAVGPSAGIETYRYGGADLTPPQPPLITCEAMVGPTALQLTVNGAYPYAGCVYFTGVTNTGSDPIRISLGSLGEHAQVTCNVPGCQASDLDFVSGGTTTALVSELCTTSGGAVTNTSGLDYSLAGGATMVCPLFVTVLQPAKENARYEVTITPPPLESGQVITLPPEPPSNNRNPIVLHTPTPTATPTVAAPTATPTPVVTATPTAVPTDIVAGVRTPGALSTPLAPNSGTGVLIQREATSSESWPLILALAALGVLATVLWPRRR